MRYPASTMPAAPARCLWSRSTRSSRSSTAIGMTMLRICGPMILVAAAVLVAAAPAAAQDVPGIELCTRESRMDRRTGCLQSNIEYLQQLLTKNALDLQQKLAAANREIAAQKEQLAAANRDV